MKKMTYTALQSLKGIPLKPHSFQAIFSHPSKEEINLIQLNERDSVVMHEISRWRFCLGRQLKILADFSSQRTCDRRLKKLIDAGYLKRVHLVYGIPGLYFATKKAKDFYNLDCITSTVRLNQLQHDIMVIDTAIYFIGKGLDEKSIITERELKHEDGFSAPKHRPDFIFTKSDEKCCVEVELTEKSKERLEKNIRDNYLNFDIQYWITGNEKIKRNLEKFQSRYSNIEIIEDKEVTEYVKELYRSKKGK